MRTKDRTIVTCDGCMDRFSSEHSWELPKGWTSITFKHNGGTFVSGTSLADKEEQIDLCYLCWTTNQKPTQKPDLCAVIKKYLGMQS